MYGAIFGDIVGSRFEFDRGPWTKNFEILTDECNWTDDTVMTVAVAEALLNAGKDASLDDIRSECVRSMKKWGQKYPDAGYGARFIHWVLTDEPTPYNSFGNGSAMRVSAAGWLYDTIERTREVARATAEVSHNHPEGIKGAECTAAVIFLGRNGASKDEIKEYVVREFGYDISKAVDELRPLHRHDETCMDTLPKALVSFLEGESLEDTIRNAVSLGGDTDTIAAIAGAMAEALYDIPLIYRIDCQKCLEEDMLQVVNDFERAVVRFCNEGDCDNEYKDNAPLSAAITLFVTANDEEERTESFVRMLNILAKRISENAMVPMPYDDVDNAFMAGIDIDKVVQDHEIMLKDDVRLKMDTMIDGDGNKWLPMFLNTEELLAGQTANVIMHHTMYDALNLGYYMEDISGVVINPFGTSMTLTKDILELFLNDYKEWARKNGILLPDEI